jgi:hypothetical protein
MPPNRPRDLPKYASRAGDPSFPPPYVVDEAGMDIFICEGNAAALGQMIDRALNIPTEHHYGGRDKLQFELADHRVGFACIDVKRLLSKPTPGQQVKSGLPANGVYAHQTEIAVMVQIKDNEGLPYWYLPYVLNGLPAAVTTGREIYGYPKQHATFAADNEKPGHGGRRPPLFGPRRRWSNRLVVRAYDLKFNRKGDEAEFTLVPVLKFRKGGTEEATPIPPDREPFDSPAAPAGPRPDDFEIYPGGSPLTAGAATAGGRVAESTPVATGSATHPEVPEEEVGAAFLQRIRSDVPYVFLRQFRDPERESFASYQAVVVGRLVPSPSDNLSVVRPDEFSLVVPWAYNLALAEQLFGLTQDPGRPLSKPVVGLLSGEHATFDVLRASILWQFGSDIRTDDQGMSQFESWREELLRARSAGSSLEAPTSAGTDR